MVDRRARPGGDRRRRDTLTTFLLAAAPLACAALIIAARSPARTFLLAYAAVVPFGSGITLPVPLDPPFNTLTTLLGVVAGGAVVVELLLVADGERSRVPAVVPLAACLLAIAALTLGWSVDRAATADEVYVLTSLVGLYVCVLLAPFDRRDAHDLGSAVAVGGVLACAYGYWLLLTDSLPMEGAGVARFSIAGGVGEDADPNITAATLVLPLAIALHRALVDRGWTRAAWASAAALVAGGILLTASRGGLLGAAVAVTVVVLARPRPHRALLGAAAAAVAVVAVSTVLAPDQLARLTARGSSGRTSVWELGMEACARECTTGSGLGTYLQIHERTFLTSPDAEGVRASLKAHNMWLQLGVEAGLVSVVLLGLLFVATVRALLRCRAVDRGAALAGTAGLLVTNLFLANVGFKYFWLVLLHAAVVAGATDAPRRIDRDVGRLLWRRMRPHLPAGALLGLLVAAVLALVGARSDAVRYEAKATVVATRPPDVAEFGLGELVEAVFEAADLDDDAALQARDDDLAYVVVGTGATPEEATERSMRAAEGLVDRYNAADLGVGGLLLSSPADASDATPVTGEGLGAHGVAATGLVVTILTAVLLGVRRPRPGAAAADASEPVGAIR